MMNMYNFYYVRSMNQDMSFHDAIYLTFMCVHEWETIRKQDDDDGEEVAVVLKRSMML